MNEARHAFVFMKENDGITKGDVVDWEGAMWTFLEQKGLPGQPTKLYLEKLMPPEQGVRKWVMLTQVRPVSIGRQKLNLPRIPIDDCDVLDTVAYDWDGDVHLGLVMNKSTEGTLTLHVLQQRKCKADITFVLNWTGGPGGKDRRMEICPAGYTADVREIEKDAVHGRVALNGNNKLTEDSRRYLESLGVDTFRDGK